MTLTTALLRGALGSLRKRPPYEDAVLPARASVAPAARIDVRHAAAYAEVCGFPPTGGTGPLPLTYPHVLGFPLAVRLMAAPDFPFPLLGLVHTAIEVEQHRALRPDDRPEIRVHAEGPVPHRRGTEFRMVTTGLLDGAEVWISRSTYLCRHRRADAVPEPRPDEGAAEPLPERAAWRLPADLGRRYGAVSGDRNPIHLHPLTARAFGFPRAVAHGMYTASRALAQAGTARGETYDWTVAFARPVLLPSTVDVAVRPAAAVPAAVRSAVEQVAPAVPDGAGDPATGLAYQAWDRTGRLHLAGRVTPR
jgi:acyl dehydratase